MIDKLSFALGVVLFMINGIHAGILAEVASFPPSRSDWVWWEAETPTATNFPPLQQNPFRPANPQEAAVLSEDQWIGVAGDYGETPMWLEYTVQVPQDAEYHFYVRKFWKHGPFRWRFDGQPWQQVSRDIALLDSEDLRKFIGANWIHAGKIKLNAGTHALRIELTQSSGAAAFDCFLLIPHVWFPRGKDKPGERSEVSEPGWFAFDPEADPFVESPIDLRFLNERFAGKQGFIQVQGDTFVHGETGEPVRFWGVNAGPDIVRLPRPYLDYLARYLAKLGVNIVRVHGRIWRDEAIRQVDEGYLDQLFYFIAAMKREGIYTALSIYFPLWLRLDEEKHGFAGYQGQHPFALLFFNPTFQAIYRDWWQVLLTTRNPYTGVPLKDEPAVAIAELVNEDSTLFWTFSYERIPHAQMAILEERFAAWLRERYGSLEKTLEAWGGRTHERDDLEAGRIGFLPLWELFNRRDKRAQDTATFLARHQRAFFEEMGAFLKETLGFQGCIYGSNWKTASPRYLGPLDKWSNLACDFLDRHGYFGGPHEGDGASYSIRKGHRFGDRSALPGDGIEGGLPIMDLTYNGKPSTITEVNWPPPNRFRAEFPVLAAAYGALQGTDGIFFFALAGPSWQRRLTKFAIETPAVMGQFPALALLYRKRGIRPADPVVMMQLTLADLFALKGAPGVEPMNLDALRAMDPPPGARTSVENVSSLDPLAFLVGKVEMVLSEKNGPSEMVDLSRFIDREADVVKSTTGELTWDFGQGIVSIHSPYVQGASGFLGKVGQFQFGDVAFETGMEYGTILIVSMDGHPIRESEKLLVQVMSEEKHLGWQTTKQDDGLKQITSLGGPPLMVRTLDGFVSLTRPDAHSLHAVALDARGYPLEEVGTAEGFSLREDVLYYLVRLKQDPCDLD